MILIRGLKLPIAHKETELLRLSAKALKLPESRIIRLKIVKKSLDARKKDDIRRIYSVAVELKGSEEKVLAAAKNKNAEKYEPYRYDIPRASSEKRPVVVGFGPGGMFAALVLAEAGLHPIVLERGQDVDTRRRAVERFWSTGELDTECNVQFGEGGAGTFSDGKLLSGINDPRSAWVRECFCRFGAPENVGYDAKPHVGTDVLARVVKNLRNRVLDLGGEVSFGSLLTGIRTQNGAVSGLCVRGPRGDYILDCDDCILAVGHSARDTFEMLRDMGLPMERKPFSMGVRIEHLQSDVGKSQYGEAYAKLPAADYKLNCRLPHGGSAYTFCMCPGGYVVAAAHEKGGVVTNGMSYSGRGGENANSALLVSLEPEDFPGEGVLAGMYWQREIEQKCFAAAGGDYKAPAQTLGDFLAGRAGTGGGKVKPSYRPGVAWCDLHFVLPEKITDTIAKAIPALSEKLDCFADGEAVLTAPETRSSSPVRILRGEGLVSAGLAGLYPCGEGAGYAGGITSAAVDGMRCAEALIAKYGKKQDSRN